MNVKMIMYLRRPFSQIGNSVGNIASDSTSYLKSLQCLLGEWTSVVDVMHVCLLSIYLTAYPPGCMAKLMSMISPEQEGPAWDLLQDAIVNRGLIVLDGKEYKIELPTFLHKLETLFAMIHPANLCALLTENVDEGAAKWM